MQLISDFRFVAQYVFRNSCCSTAPGDAALVGSRSNFADMGTTQQYFGQSIKDSKPIGKCRAKSCDGWPNRPGFDPRSVPKWAPQFVEFGRFRPTLGCEWPASDPHRLSSEQIVRTLGRSYPTSVEFAPNLFEIGSTPTAFRTHVDRHKVDSGQLGPTLGRVWAV